jgi:hypothetical protein
MKQQTRKVTRVKKALAGVALASTSLFGMVNANAVCVQTGVVEFSQTGAASTSFYITAVTAILPTFAYVFVAPAGSTFHAILSDAMAAGQVVTVTGDNPGGCPAAGTFRPGGTVIRVDRFDQ